MNLKYIHAIYLLFKLISLSQLEASSMPALKVSSTRAQRSRFLRKSKPEIISQTQKKTKILPWLSDGVKSGIASGLATALVKSILQPFDTVKVRAID